MSRHEAGSAVRRAVEISHELLAAAEQGDLAAVTLLDAERLQLLKSIRSKNSLIDPTERLLLQEISELNDRAIGLMEHLRRIKGRELDLAAVGRRAITAYAMTL